MKKLIVLLSAVFLITGCSAVRLDPSDIGKNIKILLSEDGALYNVHFDGYKYYVPVGMKFLNKEEYNASFIDKYSNRYYLFVDAISYYHKTEIDYSVEKDIHFSKVLKYNDKLGYIRIEKIENKFYVQFVYNYAKMEAYVDEKNLNDVVINMCYILRSVDFNDAVLESLIGDNILSYKEEEFTLFDTTKSNEVFLEAVDPNVEYEEKSVFDEDNFDVDDGEDSVFDE